MIESSETKEIEDGVKPLCNALNKFEGFKTHFSCEGHPEKNKYKGYVLFTSQNDEKLLSLLKRLPQIGSVTFCKENKVHEIWCRVEAEAIQGELAYSIRFGGRPAKSLRLVRQQLAEVIGEERQSFNLNIIDQY